MRTPKQIQAEIKALKKLKPVGQFSRRTASAIARAVDELIGNSFDQTTLEWEELPDNERDIIQQTIMWRDGDCDDPPSKGWGALVK